MMPSSALGGSYVQKGHKDTPTSVRNWYPRATGKNLKKDSMNALRVSQEPWKMRRKKQTHRAIEHCYALLTFRARFVGA